jgi:hypothetical protein
MTRVFATVTGESRIQVIPAGDLILDCGTNKTLKFEETIWDDLPPVNLLTANTGPTSPAITQIPGITARARSFDLSDLAYIQSEITHKFKEDSEIEIHVHWINNGSDVTNPKYVNFQMTVAVARPLQTVMSEVVYTTGNLEIAAGLGTTHFVTSFSANIPANNIKIGDYLLGEFKRIATTGGAAAPSNHPLVLAVGFHGQIDTLGSRQMYIK